LIKHMSFKYMVYSYAAKLLISSEAKANIYDIKIQRGKLKANFDRKKFVFLQHGVMGFKRVDNTFRKSPDKSRPKILDLFVVSSEYEKKVIKDYFGYSDKEIILTGLCRWDAIENKVDETNKQIFLMPTWRTWLEGLEDEKFVETDYYKNYVGLLNNARLTKLLEENNITLNFLLHPKFKDYIDNFNVETNNIKVYKFGEQKVNEVLMKSSMLITDYSSVAWDMYYQKKPILFFQFDYEEQEKYQGSYLNMTEDLFGERAFNIDELISLTTNYVENGFKEKEKFANMRPRYFSHIDKKNCERTYKAIMSNKKYLYPKKKGYSLKSIIKRIIKGNLK
jgi:CDP-glycerol glycerophosphotransferase (TagB/SpsB family)